MGTRILSYPLAATILLLGVGGCSQVPRAGLVVMRIDDTEAHIGLGRNEVGQGDRLRLLRNVCSGQKNSVCRKEVVGSGVVTRVLNDSYSEARFVTKTGVREGDFVERERPSE